MTAFAFCIFSILYNYNFNRSKKVIQNIDSNPCYHLKEVKSEGYTVEISFDKPIPEDIRLNLNSYFGYQTQAFDLPLVMRPGTPKILFSSNISLILDFFLPFVQNYTGYLICADPKNFKSSTFQIPHDVLSEVDNFMPLNMNIKHFRKTNDKEEPNKSLEPENEWSQMICYGTSYETRYCDMRHVAIYKQIFVFATQADFIFPEPFLTLGARSPPFDRSEGRLIYEPSVIHEPLSKIPGEIVHYSSTPLCYIMSRFYNSIMLWHTTFDFLVPAFHMFDKFEKNEKPSITNNSNKNEKSKNPLPKNSTSGNDQNNRYLFIRDFEVDAYPELIKTLSNHKIIFLYNDFVTRKFDRVIVGIEKLEINPSSARPGEGMFNIKYNFTKETAPNLRSSVLSALSIKEDPIDPFSPLILIIERKDTSHRFFVNIDDIEEYLLSRCDFCRVKRIDYTNENFTSQAGLTNRASVLIGVHGSGLANCLWMHPSTEKAPTAMIELFPNGYSCRDWFHGAANVSRVEYYSVMGKKDREKIKIVKKDKFKNSTFDDSEKEKLNYCKSHQELCSTTLCHDLLRDQNVTIEVGALSSVWLTIVSKFIHAQKLYE
ncbi:hypothetical protein M9Y10_021724 [Tritrichomonas musculus]|uniref:Glycosyltransferase 61 catalytic domain-containing protein n=1 Tax=Tritrichomonas musculus TaxID=1915356 RepID=A0ABR2KQU9_9EUKA